MAKEASWFHFQGPNVPRKKSHLKPREVYVFALPQTWKLSTGTHLSNLARHLPKKFYRRVASYKPDKERRDYWTYRQSVKLSVLGDVTLVVSKRRFNDPPRKIKLLAPNLPEASTCDTLSHYARRWMVETLFGALKSRGFNLEDTRLQDPERISRLLALLAIAFTWAFVVGQWQAAVKELKLKKHAYPPKGVLLSWTQYVVSVSNQLRTL